MKIIVNCETVPQERELLQKRLFSLHLSHVNVIQNDWFVYFKDISNYTVIIGSLKKDKHF